MNFLVMAGFEVFLINTPDQYSEGSFSKVPDQDGQVSYKPNYCQNGLVTTESFQSLKLLTDKPKEMQL